MKIKKIPIHYVDNKVLYVAMVEHRAKYLAAKEAGTELPRVSNYIGDCLLKISTRLSLSPNFVNYPFREEMVMDGVENCLAYLHNFDPDHIGKRSGKKQNPFAYFTQIIWFAFLRRIAKEKKQLVVKQKALQNFQIEGMLVAGQAEFESLFHNRHSAATSSDYMNDLVSNFDEKNDAKNKKARKKGLEKFID